MKRTVFNFSQRTKINAVVLLVGLLPSGMSWANPDELISMGTIAVSKPVGNYTVYGAGVKIDESLSGQIASVGIAGKVNAHWYWRAEYFGLFLDHETGNTHDNRMRTVLNYIKPYDNWQLSARPMIEYRNSEALNGFRFRPEVALSYPLTLKAEKITPTFKMEPFYEIRSERITLTLFTLGADWSINSNFTLSVNYIKVIAHQRNTDREGPAVTLKIRL